MPSIVSPVFLSLRDSCVLPESVEIETVSPESYPALTFSYPCPAASAINLYSLFITDLADSLPGFPLIPNLSEEITLLISLNTLIDVVHAALVESGRGDMIVPMFSYKSLNSLIVSISTFLGNLINLNRFSKNRPAFESGIALVASMKFSYS